MFENSFKNKVSIVNEIKKPKSAKYWQYHILVTEITNIIKKKHRLWLPNINKINKYISVNINSIQTISDLNSISFVKNKLLVTKITNKNIKLYVIKAINIPKTDPYILFKFERDKIGIKSKYLENTLIPQWNELVDLSMIDPNENLFVQIWDKNI